MITYIFSKKTIDNFELANGRVKIRVELLF